MAQLTDQGRGAVCLRGPGTRVGGPLPRTGDLGEVSMPDHRASRGPSCPRAALGAALGLLFALPATAAAQEPLPLPLPEVPAVPSAPSAVAPAISLPVAVPAGRPCPGARRRSGARARRIAVGCLVNKARTRAGLRGFGWNRALGRAAARHARDMARRGYFAHQRSGGPSHGAAGPRGRLPRPPGRRGDRLRLRRPGHAARGRADVAGEPTAPRDPAVVSQPRRRRRRRAPGGPLRRARRDLRARRRLSALSSPGGRPRRSRGPRA